MCVCFGEKRGRKGRRIGRKGCHGHSVKGVKKGREGKGREEEGKLKEVKEEIIKTSRAVFRNGEEGGSKEGRKRGRG